MRYSLYMDNISQDPTVVTWQLGDRVARFDGSTGSVESIETTPWGEQNVHVQWDDPATTDEFNGIRADNLISEDDYNKMEVDE